MPARNAKRLELPALIAAVTDLSGAITAVQRTYLSADGSQKAPLDEPRRALGDLLGNGVRFGEADDVLLAGEGIETVLSLRSLMPGMPMVSGLTGAHLAALKLPKSLQRLYIAMDNDTTGIQACEQLTFTAFNQGIDVFMLSPAAKDWNDDLRAMPRNDIILRLASMLLPDDAARFLRNAPA